MLKFLIIFLQASLSEASTHHWLVSIPAFVRALNSDRPYVYLGAPIGLFDLTQHESIFRGKRDQFMRITWPDHRSCCLHIYVSIDDMVSLCARSSIRIR